MRRSSDRRENRASSRHREDLIVTAAASAPKCGAVVEQLEHRQLLTIAPLLTCAQLKVPTNWTATHFDQLSPDLTGSSTPSGLTPAEMEAAYGANNIQLNGVTGNGSGQTIAIVDAYDYPTALNDLNKFSSYFSLPQFDTGNGPTFTKYNQSGTTSSLPGTDPAGAGNDDWEIEEALDIEWAHVMAPDANIDLVEANDSSGNLFTADQTAANLSGVSVVSNSWGGSEYSGENSSDSIFTHTGVTFVISAGDSGAYASNSDTIQPEYPTSSPDVLSVGGTTLSLGSGSSYGSESAWGYGTSSGFDGGGGGGISSYEPIPSFQVGKINGLSTSERTYPDVSIDANPDSGVPIYDTYDFGASNGWFSGVGGTSLAAPMWSGLIAIANQGRTLAGAGDLTGATQTLPDLYSMSASDFHDVTTGSNGYSAGAGYDLATGIGSPIANLLVPSFTSSVSTAPAVTSNPASQTLAVGQTATFTAAATGSPTPTVQWMLETSGSSSFSAISGATSTTLSLGAATLAESGNVYEAVFSNGVGSPATTTAATLTVNPATVAPDITTNPTTQTLTVGQTASFTAAASGTPTPTVQWMVETSGSSSFTAISGATSTTLSLGAATLAESGNKYEAVFTNGVGSPATSTAATLTVNAATAAPVITTNPISQTLTVGQTASFTAAASGTPTPTVQWMLETVGSSSFTAISGATATTLSLGAATLVESGSKYEAVFTNGVGSPATTNPATLTVNAGAASGSLSGSQSVAQTSAYNLTTSGTSDWAHWGRGGTYGNFDHKASGNSQISNVTTGGSGGNYGGYAQAGRAFTWTDGTPTASDTNETGYIWANGSLQTGYSFTVPADTTTRTLYVYAGGYNTDSSITAQLSDGSASNVTLTAGQTGLYSKVYVFTYTAASAGQTLKITLLKTGNLGGVTNGSADLVAAALVSSGSTTAAPVITTNPTNQRLTVGQTAAFTAGATGAPAPTVQWMVLASGAVGFTAISGATSTTLSLGAATLAESGNQYEAVFSNGIGSPATTTAAVLSVTAATAAPAVTTNPTSQTLTVGQAATFTAAASGTPTPTVQWMVETSGSSSFTAISGATSTTLSLGAATLAESGNKYEAVFTNGVGSPATTTAATLTVSAATAVPVVTTNPVSQTLTVGQTAAFTAAASGTPTPTVQWMVETSGSSSFTPISGATSTTLSLGAATLAESGNKYEAVFTNGVGSPATTSAATLTVSAANAAPVVTTNPVSQTLTVGQTAAFTAAATGTPTPTVQWMVETSGSSSFTAISGATSTTLSLGAATLAESGNKYEAVFTNGVGSPATTSAATLTVNAATATGSLTGSESVAQTSAYNLTTIGASDWAHWGRGGTYGNFDHKASGSSQIANVTTVGSGGNYGGWSDPSRSFSWTDGTPTASDTSEHGYIWANGALQTGFSFTVPADTTTRTLYVYAGGYSTNSSITAILSDGSASAVTLTAGQTGIYANVYAITYHAASAGQTLKITLLKTGNLGGVTDGSADLIAAALVG